MPAQEGWTKVGVDPIRRVLSTADGLVGETRQHRARIEGAPAWWSE
jgi:hypothetical protein